MPISNLSFIEYKMAIDDVGCRYNIKDEPMKEAVFLLKHPQTRMRIYDEPTRPIHDSRISCFLLYESKPHVRHE